MTIQITQKTINAVAISLSPTDWKSHYWQARSLRVIRATLDALAADGELHGGHEISCGTIEPSWPSELPELKYRPIGSTTALAELQRQREAAMHRVAVLTEEIVRQQQVRAA